MVRLIGGSSLLEPSIAESFSKDSLRRRIAIAAHGTSRSITNIFHFSDAKLTAPDNNACKRVLSIRAIARGERTI